MSAAPDKDGRFGRLANCWESFKGWGRKYFDRDDQSCGVWWFMAGLFDAITLVSMVQAAAEPVWLVPAGLDGGWGAETYHVELTYTERVLLYVGMACGIAKWILIALRATNRFVKIGSHLAIFFVFGQLVFTSVCYGMFMSSLRDKKILIPMEAAEGYISALITIVCAACSLPLHIIDASLGCPNDMVSLPKRDMLLATLLAMTTYLVGGAVYEAMEGWKYHESFYFCIVFLTTIGYGHLNVKTRGGYVFSIFYGIFGITMTVNLLFAIRAVMIEWIEISIRPWVEEWVRRRSGKRDGATTRDVRRMSTVTMGGGGGVDATSYPLQRTQSSVSRTYSIPFQRTRSNSVDPDNVPLGIMVDSARQMSTRRDSFDTTNQRAGSQRSRSFLDEEVPRPPVADEVTHDGSLGEVSPPSNGAPAAADAIDVPKGGGLQWGNLPGESSDAPKGGGLQWGNLPAGRNPPAGREETFDDGGSLYSMGTTSVGGYGFNRTMSIGGWTVPRTMSAGGKSTRTVNRGLELQRRRSIWLMEAGDAFKEEEKIQVWTDRSIAIAMALTCIAYWLFGAAVFMAMEPDWDYLESVWFCFVTISTTGFGDYFPSTPRSWQFWTYYSLFNIALWAYALSVLGNLLHSQSGSLIEFHHKDTGV